MLSLVSMLDHLKLVKVVLLLQVLVSQSNSTWCLLLRQTKIAEVNIKKKKNGEKTKRVNQFFLLNTKKKIVSRAKKKNVTRADFFRNIF